LTDIKLNDLFSRLPDRCIILLEDMDATGLDRDAITKYRHDEKLQSGENTKRSGSTLLGFLNATDGVGSQEGRILVITTNHIRNLDGALLRPGRVDIIIEFKLATKDQARKLFISIYYTELDVNDGSGLVDVEGGKSQLELQADKFVEEIPEDSLSPASLQNFLVLRRNQPDKAVCEIGDWVRETIGKDV
jgi:mitochondrial chaperone BCS1